MTAFRSTVFLAALAGLLAGLVLALVQTFATVPLILAAETYETAAPVAAEAHAHAPGTPDHAHEAPAVTAAAGHSHDHGEGWAPADGFERFTFTLGANLVSGIGFALLLVAASEALGGIGSVRQGLFWGLGGFAAVALAPGLGLPPELPGMPAADLVARQGWWIGCALATAGGLALLAFGRARWLPGLGVALLALPHLVGAPQPVSHETAVPPDLHHAFVVAVTVSSLVFWAALGALVGLFRPRFAAGLAPQDGGVAPDALARG